MKKFRDNLYLLTAISYFLDNESEIDLGEYRAIVYNVKNDYYCGNFEILEERIPSICFWVGISDKQSVNSFVYQTRFYKPTRISVEEIEYISENDKMRFVMTPVKTLPKTPYLSDSYFYLFLVQIAREISFDEDPPAPEDYLSCINPSIEIQAEVAKKLKEKLYRFSSKSINDNQFTL